MGNCKTCNAPKVYELYDDGNDELTLKLIHNDYGNKYVEFLVRDGNYNFQSACVPASKFDCVIRRLLRIRKDIKKWRNGQ